MTNEEIYKKAIPLSKEELIDFLIEMNEDNNRQQMIIKQYEKMTGAGIEEIKYTPECPYSGYKITTKDFSYYRNMSGGIKNESNIS